MPDKARPAAAPEPPPIPPPDLRPRLRPTVTVACWVVVAILFIVFLFAGFAGSHLVYFETPAVTVLAVGDKDLALDDALESAPGWERILYRLMGYSREDNAREIAAAYRRVIRYAGQRGEPDPASASVVAIQASLAVLEWERDRPAEAEDALDLLADGPASDTFIDAALYAYEGDASRGLPADAAGWDLSALDPGIDGLPAPLWSRARLEARLADRAGRPAEAQAALLPVVQRGLRLLQRSRVIEGVFFGTLALGLAALPGRLRRREDVGSARLVAPWSFAYGSHVMARCVAASAAVSTLLFYEPLYVWGTFFASLPMLLILQVYLLRPFRTNLVRVFGLAPGALAWRPLATTTLALIALDQLGCLAIDNGLRALGWSSFWEEGIDESLLFGSGLRAAMSTVDGVVWAPLFEEIAFRGLFYITLRTRLRPVPAAVISGTVFGAVHLYSLTGFLQVTWTGMVLALAYERSRSLWPCILAHAFNNLVYFGNLLLVYR